MPLEQIGNALTFEAFYTDSGSGALGLTVTVDVWELTAGGVATEIVAGGAATEMGDGLYYYQLAAGSVDAEAIYTAVFKTADACDQAHIVAGWVVGPTWVENVDAASSTLATSAALAIAQADLDNPTQYWADLTGISTLTAAQVWAYVTRTLTAGGLSAAEVWSYATRTLTYGGVLRGANRMGDTIEVYQYSMWSISITGLGDLSTRTALYFTMKDQMSEHQADASADFQVEETLGLVACSSVASWVSGDATLTVDDVAQGNITIEAFTPATMMPQQTGRYDVKMITATGAQPPLREGLYALHSVVTLAVA